MRQHCSGCLVALALLAGGPPGSAQSLPSPGPGDATFNVFLRSTLVGSERVTLTRVDDGWEVTSNGRVSGPLDLVIQRFEVRYDAEWRPTGLQIDATLSGGPFSVRTAFEGQTATNEIVDRGESRAKTDQISADAVVLPTNFFGSYEAMAARLSTSEVGAELPAYIAPQGEILVRLNDVLTEQFQTPQGIITARRHRVTFLNAENTFDAEIWSDDRQRLLRFSIPPVGLEIARTDIISVAARRIAVSHPGDVDVRIPAAGFSLAATLTIPTAEPGRTEDPRWPAVILVPSSGSQDRDEVLSDVPLHGQLAGALAEAGFLAVRYDKRGVGQSGGRLETVTLRDYAEDVRSVVRFLRDRDDVDDDRLIVLGHGDAGWIALEAAARERRLQAVALLAVPATSGGDLVLEQQRRALDKMSLTDRERQAKVELQDRIHRAVLTGEGWEGIPAETRAQAETPWFKSFLEFDVGEIMEDLRQPVLVVHGELDREVPVAHGERLVELAQARDRREPAVLRRIEGVNHLLVPARTGEPEEYAALEDRSVSDRVIEALTLALAELLPARR